MTSAKESTIEKRTPDDEMDAMWGDAASAPNEHPGARWFRNLKYSMFIHWGLYSHLGGRWKGKTYYGIGEWIMSRSMADIPVDEYKKVASEFNPTAFDAQTVVRLAKDASTHCIVVTAKHHEGFAMFDSRDSDFTIVKATPFGRDPLRELADACRTAGIRLGFYYSQFQDWVEPDGGGSKCVHPNGFEPDFDRYFNGKVMPQVRQLLTEYGPISVVWFDTPGRMGRDYSQRLVDLVHELQPDCLVNSRVGNGLGDYSTLGDMELPAKTPGDGLYECIDTTNDSWSFAYHDCHWKSPTTIAQSLIRAIARGCNFMLNIGPAPDGAIPGEATEALEKAGAWIHANQEAIYGTTASPFAPFSWGDCTVKGDNLYLHLFDWPGGGILRLSGLGVEVLDAELLATGEKLPVQQSEDRIELTLPRLRPTCLIHVVKLHCEAPPVATTQDLVIDGENRTDFLAEYAETHGVCLKSVSWMETFGAWKKAANLTDWSCHTRSSAVWRMTVLKPGTYSATVEYACSHEAEGSEWVLISGCSSLRFRALDTGLGSASPGGRNRMRYMAIEVGTIRFETAGRHTLSLSPLSNSETDTIWVKKISLAPWV